MRAVARSRTSRRRLSAANAWARPSTIDQGSAPAIMGLLSGDVQATTVIPRRTNGMSRPARAAHALAVMSKAWRGSRCRADAHQGAWLRPQVQRLARHQACQGRARLDKWRSGQKGLRSARNFQATIVKQRPTMRADTPELGRHRAPGSGLQGPGAQARPQALSPIDRRVVGRFIRLAPCDARLQRFWYCVWPNSTSRDLSSVMGLRRSASTCTPRCTASRATMPRTPGFWGGVFLSTMPWFCQLRSHGKVAYLGDAVALARQRVTMARGAACRSTVRGALTGVGGSG